MTGLFSGDFPFPIATIIRLERRSSFPIFPQLSWLRFVIDVVIVVVVIVIVVVVIVVVVVVIIGS